MAKERLSKLQKWILNRAKENLLKDMEKEYGRGFALKEAYLSKREICRDYYGWFGKPKDTPQKYRVSIFRAIYRLKEKGLIKSFPYRDFIYIP